MNLIIKELYIPTTKNKRTIRVLLPDDYHQKDISYPVLYMHDGQNLFEDETSYNHTSWKIHETMSYLKENKLIDQDIIIVGIDNSDLRQFEYAPFISKDLMEDMLKVQIGGLGDVYGEFIVKKVKSYIQRNFRALGDYENTFIAGSSMGAYISTYIASKYPTIFKAVGVFSLASWFNEEDFLDYITYSNIKPDMRFFISIGRYESSGTNQKKRNKLFLNNSRNLKSALENKYINDIFYIETDDTHNELAWRKMFTQFIIWLLKK
ncbi:alpha/beta hydrolase [Mariniplasma anaerobium]|uniref:Esterase n=1 Tax=Mariniplasma anaerobium TaxID=2735436 RepID=A0A7U9TM01_9MOLU|nr:alpha/beta hydrolase-fold protein [Mariniplasma anaerobium]BCR36484.1 esterase [Mariniplasma anaerobium]